MDWIKTKYDRAILLAAAVALVASAAFLFLKAQSFSELFTPYLAPFSKSTAVKALNTDPVTEANNALANPAKWKPAEKKFLFVAEQYLLSRDGKLTPFEGADILHDPVPNDWFVKYNIDLLAPDAKEQDGDSDRFNNVDEWKGGTDPTDPKSHPPFSDKLRLKQFIQIPFRLVFKARNGEELQINTIDLKQPSQFLKVGDQIAGTKFKITKLDVKAGVDSYGTPTDVSEATVQNAETKAEIILVLGVIANSPDTYALFRYLYDNTEFRVKRDGEFKLKPDDSTVFKLIDINSTEALITIPATGKKITVPKL